MTRDLEVRLTAARPRRRPRPAAAVTAIPMHTLSTLVRKTARRLEAAGVGDARLEADLIWTTALGVDRAALYAAFPEAPHPDAERRAASYDFEMQVAQALQARVWRGSGKGARCRPLPSTNAL